MAAEAIHVVPLNDTRDHITSQDCWCDPDLDVFGDVFVHNSADDREAYETGKRRPH
jgi:hypothetical protein